MILYKEYVKTETENKEIKFVISFNKETTNWATNQPKKKGYQVTVVPVTISRRANISMEEYGAFTGFNDCLLETDRQSSTRLEKAIDILQQRKETYLLKFKD